MRMHKTTYASRRFARWSFWVLVLLLMVPIGLSAADTLDYDTVLKTIDDLQNFENNDFSAIYTIVSDKPGEEREVLEVWMYRRDSLDLFLLIIRKPEIQKGQGYLQVEDNFWFYDPGSRKFEHSSVKENLQNSDAKNSDLMQESLAEDYRVVSHTEETLGGVPVYVLDLEAKHSEVAYPVMRVWVRKSPTLPMKSEEYGYSGKLMRRSAYLNYVRTGDKYLPTRILFEDMLNIGEKTQITMTNPSVAKLPDYVFTKAYLERVNE